MFHPDPASKQSAKPVWHIPIVVYTVLDSSDDGQKTCLKHVEFYSKNKFEKLVHLVGFIIRIYHDARSSEYQIGHFMVREWTLLCIEKEAQWAPGLVWLLWGGEKSLVPSGNWNLYCPAHSLFFILTMLLQLPMVFNTYINLRCVKTVVTKYC